MSSAWLVVLGIAGGTLNAFLSDNYRLWPTRIRVADRSTIVRPGLLLSAVAGGIAALIACWAFVLPARIADTLTLQTASLGSAFIGLVAARLMTSEADKRALRAAACLASAAPAADPDTVRAIEIAQPFEAYRLADDLRPRHAAPGAPSFTGPAPPKRSRLH